MFKSKTYRKQDLLGRRYTFINKQQWHFHLNREDKISHATRTALVKNCTHVFQNLLHLFIAFII